MESSKQTSLFRFLSKNAIQLQTNQSVPFSISDIHTLKLTSINIDQVLAIKDQCKELTTLTLPIQFDSIILNILGQINSLTNLRVFIHNSVFDTLIVFKNIKELSLGFLETLKITNSSSILLMFPKLVSIGTLTKIDEDQISFLSEAKELREVKIYCISISCEMIDLFTRTLPYLTSLTLYSLQLTDKHLKILSNNLYSLQYLDISQNDKVTLAGLEYLKKFSESLRALIFNRKSIDLNDQFLIFAFSFKNLKQLGVSSLELSQNLFDLIPSFPPLQNIELNGRLISFQRQIFRQFFSKLPYLKSITINPLLTDMLLKTVISCVKTLESLTLQSQTILYQTPTFKVTDQICFKMSSLQHLKSINFENQRVQQVGVMKILRNTQGINFSCNQFIQRMFDYSQNKKQRNIGMFKLSRHMVTKYFKN